MKVINASNVNDALVKGIEYIQTSGFKRDSRNGSVLMAPEPVCTVYSNPEERVLFNPIRDCNPFFHLYESIWMLAGRRDVESVTNFVSTMKNFSDQGIIFHGAYGYRWRKQFKVSKQSMGDFSEGAPNEDVTDQLSVIIKTLKNNPDDRRCVLQIWDAELDLGKDSKDIPCNLTVHFQISVKGQLDMTVFNRSNDIIWGAYGANAVHFSFLQEYIARQIGVKLGCYRQVSDNYHAYLNTLEKVKDLPKQPVVDPYSKNLCRIVEFDASTSECEDFIRTVRPENKNYKINFGSIFLREIAQPMCFAYFKHKQGHTQDAIADLRLLPNNVDWKIAGLEWLQRRNKNV